MDLGQERTKAQIRKIRKISSQNSGNSNGFPTDFLLTRLSIFVISPI